MKTGHKISDQEKLSAKRILYAIIQLDGGEFHSQTRLYKVFYWAHLHFWQHSSGVLSSYPMARMPHGPGIDQGENLLFDMQAQGLIKIQDNDPEDDKLDRVFTLVMDFQANLTADEHRAILHGLSMVRGKSAKQVSEETHISSRNWKRLRDGQIMDVYEDALTDDRAKKVAAANESIKCLLIDFPE